MVEDAEDVAEVAPVPDAPKGGVEEARLFKVTQLIKSAKAPLVVIGKGAAYARAEGVIRDLIDKTNLPFLPTPMSKGVVADSHPANTANTASARSTALREADVVLILGARLNWILHFGGAPKWNPQPSSSKWTSQLKKKAGTRATPNSASSATSASWYSNSPPPSAPGPTNPPPPPLHHTSSTSPPQNPPTKPPPPTKPQTQKHQ